MSLPIGITTTRHGRAAQRAAWAFYLIAALGSGIGQVWVGVTTPPWPPAIVWWWRAVMVAPFAAVIDLGGVVTAAFADARQRLGEPALGWRILSTAAATTGVGINIIGHANVPYLATVFGGLGIFAYTVWLLHAAARRRDALRAVGKLDDTAPAYGLAQWRREPAVTRRARALALAHGYTLQESLSTARQQMRDEQRRAALARHVDTLIRARHNDPVVAAIAATTLDIEAVAAELTARADVTGWATVIGANLAPPHPVADPTGASGEASTQSGPTARLPAPKLSAAVMRRIPVHQADYDRWRQMWAELATTPDLDIHQFAQQHRVSVRQVQWIRSIGPTGLLDSPIPPVVRLAHLAGANGHQPPTPTPAE
jgi:hypothetical protein